MSTPLHRALTPNRRPWGLLAGLSAAIALVVAVAVVVFGYFADLEQAQQRKTLQAVAAAERALLRDFVGERRTDAQLLALRHPIWLALAAHDAQTPTPEQERELLRSLGEARDSHGYREVQVFDPELQPLAPADGADPDELDAPERAALLQCMRERRQVLVAVHREPNGGLEFGIAQPVFYAGNAAREPLGGLYLHVDLQRQLDTLLQAWPVDASSAESLLIRPMSGGRIAYLSPLRWPSAGVRTLEPTTQGAPALHALLASGKAGGFQGLDYRGVAVLGAASPIPGTPWWLVVKEDSSEAHAPLQMLAVAIAGVGTLLVVLLVLGARLWRREQLLRLHASRTELDLRYRAAIQASIDGYQVLDEKGIVLEANDAMLAMMGYARQDVVGHHIREFNLELDMAEIRSRLEQVRRDGSGRFQTRRRRHDGSVLDVDVSLVWVPGTKERPGVFHQFVRDIGPELQARRRIERLNAFYVFLHNTNAAIARCTTTLEVLQAVCEGAVRDAKFLLAWGGVADFETGVVRPECAYGPAKDYVRDLHITLDPDLPTSQGPTGLSMRDGQIVYTDDFQRDARTAPWSAAGTAFGLRSSVSVPVLMNGKAVAAFTFYADEPGHFDPELRALLEEAARMVSFAWQARESEQQARATAAALQSSELRFAQVFEVGPLPMQIFSLSSRKLKAINLAHRNTFGYALEKIPDEDAWFETVHPDAPSRAMLRANWHAALERKRAARDAGTDKNEPSPEMTLHCADGSDKVMRCFVSLAGDDVIIQWEDLTQFKLDEQRIAAYVRQLEGTMRGTLEAVARMVDMRDPYTAGHERRVGLLAQAIALEMGWAPERAESLQLMGLVHDIGKIAIPAEILSKPTRLTELEYELVKTHVERGYEILKDVAFPLPIAEIIRQHHERLDGSGYPFGLQGDQILPEARVLAVADVIESMASHRPYRPALGLDSALSEIRQHRGSLYDAEVVDAALRLIRDRQYQIPL